VSILLNIAAFPWSFVKDNTNAIGQLLYYFPDIISTALVINSTEVLSDSLRMYQPKQWQGDTDQLGTQWIGWIPAEQFQTLESYIATTSSPIYNQTGIQGTLARQIDSSYPIGTYSNLNANSATNKSEATKQSNRKRDIIIGVCVGVGGLLGVLFIFWIYKRIKRSNERTVNKRLSEHMSMFSGRMGADNPFGEDRRHSVAPSIAASEIDDRPSSFYASPLDNYPAMRHRQNAAEASYYSDQAATSDISPTRASMFGNAGAWVQPGTSSAAAHRASYNQQNPFDDVYAGSGQPSSPRMSARPQRRSVQKAMISQPTLQGNSLEFNDYDYSR
jgi:hypothetical protein